MKKKSTKDKLIKQAKSNISLGILSVPTVGLFSRVGSAHPAMAPVTGSVVTGMNLLNVGNIAKSGLVLAEVVSDQSSQQSSKKKSGNKYIDKIL